MLPTKFLLFMLCVVGLSSFGYYMVKDKKLELKRPHIIFIIADDMGWNDVSFHGANQIQTPNIDALAYNGVILNKHYVLPMCTPSRTSLLTSRYAIREGMQGWPLKTGELRGLSLNRTLMPEYFRKLGYASHLVGKWHLGYATENYTPTSRGYDSFFGYYNGLITYFTYSVKQTLSNVTTPMGYDLHRDSPGNLTVGRGGSKYFTDLITDEAEKLIKANGNEKPLFLQIAHLAVHSSDEALEVRNMTEVNNTFGHIKDSNRQKYAGMLKAMDESVGRVVTALSEADMLENSIIVFISDNGAPTFGLYENFGSNYPLRGIKNTVFEGGVRGVACIFSPLIKAASRVSYEMMHVVDWLPTLYSAAGGNVSDLTANDIDGIDQWPSISRDKRSLRNSMLINIDMAEEAAIIGNHKLVKHAKDEGHGHYGDSGNNSSYPAYQLKDVLNSPAGLAIRKLPLFNSVPKKKALKLRESSVVQCNRTATPANCTSVCLFDLDKDPCETQDLSSQLPNVVKELEKEIERYRPFYVPAVVADTDPCSDVVYFNGVCMPWRINDTLPQHVVPGTSCERLTYNFTTAL